MSLFWIREHGLLVLAYALSGKHETIKKGSISKEALDGGVFASLTARSLAGGEEKLLSVATAPPHPPISQAAVKERQLWMVGALPEKISQLPEFLVELRVYGRPEKRFILKNASPDPKASQAIVIKNTPSSLVCVQAIPSAIPMALLDPETLGSAPFLDSGPDKNTIVWPYIPAPQQTGTGIVRLSLDTARDGAQVVVLEDERSNGELDLDASIGCAYLRRSSCGAQESTKAQSDVAIATDVTAFSPVSEATEPAPVFIDRRRSTPRRLELLMRLVPRDMVLFAPFGDVTLVPSMQDEFDGEADVSQNANPDTTDRETGSREKSDASEKQGVVLLEGTLCGYVHARVGQALRGDVAFDQAVRNGVHRWATSEVFDRRCAEILTTRPKRRLDPQDLFAIWTDPSLYALRICLEAYDLARLAPLLAAVEQLWHTSFEEMGLQSLHSLDILPLLASSDISDHTLKDLAGAMPEAGGLFDRFATWLWGEEASRFTRPTIRAQACLISGLSRSRHARALVQEFRPPPSVMAELLRPEDTETIKARIKGLRDWLPEAAQHLRGFSVYFRAPSKRGQNASKVTDADLLPSFLQLELLRQAYPKIATFFGDLDAPDCGHDILSDIAHMQALVTQVQRLMAGKTTGLLRQQIQACLEDKSAEVLSAADEVAWKPLTFESVNPPAETARTTLCANAQKFVGALHVLSAPRPTENPGQNEQASS